VKGENQMGIKKLLVLLGLFGFAFSGMIIGQAVAASDVIEIKAASWYPPQHPMFKEAYEPYAKVIEERTNGKVKFIWFPGGTLAKAAQTYDAVKTGLADMAMPMALWTVESQFPVSTVVILPFMTDSAVQVADLYYRAFQAIPEIRKEYGGLKVLGFHTTELVNLDMKSTQIKTYQDLAGKKVWPGSATSVKCLKLWGAVPRMTKIEDLYMSLQRGTLDGCTFPWVALKAFRLTEVTASHTVLNFTAGQNPIVMNLDKWKSLPPDVQKVFEELAPSIGLLVGHVFAKYGNRIEGALKKRGDFIYHPTPEQKAQWKEKVMPVYQGWVKQVSAKGVDGETILKKVQALAAEVKKNPPKPAAWWGKRWQK
jgi:TRAP-type transport system periplasmic protein